MNKCSRVMTLMLAALVQSFMAQGVVAGVMTLKNGDRLQGELVKLEAEVVIWASDSFGELTVPKAKIENLQTATLLKMDGYEEPCTLFGMDGLDVLYSCKKDVSGEVPLLALEQVLPYEDYQSGAHTYRGKFALAGTYSRGNTVEDDWDMDSEVEFRRGDYRHSMSLDYESKSKDDEPADETFVVKYGMDWFFEPQWFWYNTSTISADEPKNVDERYTFGTGLGYQVWELDRTALALRGGLTYVKELFDRSDEIDPDFKSASERVAWQFSTDFRYKLPLGAELFHLNTLIQSLEDSADWVFATETGLNVPLGAGLFSEFKAETVVDNLPQADKRREDSKFSVGIGYEW